MQQRGHVHKTKMLWSMIVLAVIYGGALHYFRSLTGSRLLDGGLGVALGLFICSRPAANAVDLVFAERSAFLRTSSQPSGIRWLVINALALVAGWVVIVLGAMRLFG